MFHSPARARRRGQRICVKSQGSRQPKIGGHETRGHTDARCVVCRRSAQMNQQADSAMRNHRAPMRTLVFVTALAALDRGRNRSRERGIGTKQPHAAPGDPRSPPGHARPRPGGAGRSSATTPAGLAARHAARGRHQDPRSRGVGQEAGNLSRLLSGCGLMRLCSVIKPGRPGFDWGGTRRRRPRFDIKATQQLCFVYRLRRYSVGVRPACLRNAVANELASPKPRPSPICVTAKSGVANRLLAFSMRRLTR